MYKYYVTCERCTGSAAPVIQFVLIEQAVGSWKSSRSAVLIGCNRNQLECIITLQGKIVSDWPNRHKEVVLGNESGESFSLHLTVIDSGSSPVNIV